MTTLRQKCKELNYDYRKALILYSVLPIQEEGCLEVLQEDNEEYEDMIKTLCQLNKNLLTAKFIDNNNWKTFIKKLRVNLNGNGHKDNQQQSSIIALGKDVESIFNQLNMEHDVDLIVSVTENYYKAGDYRKKLVNYFRENFEMDVNNKTIMYNIQKMRTHD